MALVSQAEHARLCGVSRKSVTIWKAQGRLVMVGDQVDHEASYKGDSWHGGAKKARQDAPAGSPIPAPAAEDQRIEPAAPPVQTTPPADQASQVYEPPEVMSSTAHRLKEGLARKEDFKGRREELNFLKDAGRLIDIDVARDVLFTEARAARDVWLNFVPRNAALIAADLGVEADKVAEVLTGYVHKQLAVLGDPTGEFRKG